MQEILQFEMSIYTQIMVLSEGMEEAGLASIFTTITHSFPHIYVPIKTFSYRNRYHFVE